MKGIILAAGKGTRLYPMTKPICKPLLPVYDKPLLYYPLSVLQQAGIRDVLIIVPPDDTEPFVRLLGDGSQLGMNIQYIEQKVQRGIADAFVVGEQFIGDDDVCLILGDNIFYGDGFENQLAQAMEIERGGGAVIFGYYVEHPEAFGVVEFGANGEAISIEEKPAKPKSNYIVPGLYFYDNRVVQIAKRLQPSARGELEITSVNNTYLELGELNVVKLNPSFTWLDAGTEDSLLQAAVTIQRLRTATGVSVGCIEEYALKNGWIDAEQVRRLADGMRNTKYGDYLLERAERKANKE